MICPPKSFRRRTTRRSASRCAFTLIELLAVITIILILAGLILGLAGHARYKTSLARASVEIQQMSTAMESYKVDNGTYPTGPANNSTSSPPAQTSTDSLNAQTNTDPGASNSPYIAASTFLFQQLSGNTQLAATNPTTTVSKAYITFTPSQLSTGNVAPTSATYLIDPFGFSYGYSTANAYATQWTPSTVSTAGYNPTFDLWSTAGYAPTGGKSLPTGITNTTVNTLWVKNW